MQGGVDTQCISKVLIWLPLLRGGTARVSGLAPQVAGRFRPADLVAGLEVHGHLDGEFAGAAAQRKLVTCR
jgi:hypothetical protein